MKRCRQVAIACLSVMICLHVSGCSSEKSRPSVEDRPAENDPRKNAPEVETALKVSAAQLASDFKVDEATADKKYKDKSIIVEGEVQFAIKHLSGEPTICLKVGKDIGEEGVQLFFTPSARGQATELTKGQTITVRGKCAGRSVFVVVMDCEFLQASEDPVIRVTADQLTKGYAEDPDAADKRYSHKQLRIEGIVFAVSATDESCRLILEGFDEKGAKPLRVAGSFPSVGKDEFATLRKGQKVTIKGECIGKVRDEVCIDINLLLERKR